MENTQEFTRLKSLIFQIFGVADVQLNTEVNMLKTLSEDNDEFLDLFQSEFKVDMSTFPYYKYFAEDQFIFLNIFKRIFPSAFKKKPGLTVGHLLKVINKGYWFE